MKPIAVCTACGVYTAYVETINTRCGKRYSGKQCHGVYGSALCVDDWMPCSYCDGTGRGNDSRCEVCQGTTLVYVRK